MRARLISTTVVGLMAVTAHPVFSGEWHRDLSPIAQNALRAMGRRAEVEESRHFRVYAAERRDLVWIARAADQAFDLIDKRLRGEWVTSSLNTNTQLVLLIVTDRAWRKITQSAGLRVEGAAMQFGRELIVALSPERGELVQRIAHEVAHERIQHYFGRNLPIWLEEGTARTCGWDAAVAIRKAEGWSLTRQPRPEGFCTNCISEDIVKWVTEYPPNAEESDCFNRCAEAFVRALQQHLGYVNYVRFLWAVSRTGQRWDSILRSQFGFSDEDFAQVEFMSKKYFEREL